MPDGDRPPLAGRLLGLAAVLLLLALAVRFVADTVAVVVPLVLPILALVGIGLVVVRRIGRK